MDSVDISKMPGDEVPLRPIVPFVYTRKRAAITMSVAMSLELCGVPYAMAWDKNGKAMLSDPVKEGDNKWTEKEVFGADILSYISNRYDTEAEYGYEAGTSQATMVAERVKLLFDETEGRPFTIHLLFRLEYYLKNSMGAFVVGDKLTIADVAWFPHVFLKCVPTIDSGLFPHVREWYFRLAAVSDVRKGAIGAGWGFEDQRFLDLLGRGQAARDGTV